LRIFRIKILAGENKTIQGFRGDLIGSMFYEATGMALPEESSGSILVSFVDLSGLTPEPSCVINYEKFVSMLQEA